MTDLKTIRAEIRALQRQEEELVAASFQERLPAFRALVGRTFVEGCPPQWDTYIKIIDVVEAKSRSFAYLIEEKVIIDNMGKAEIKLDTPRIYAGFAIETLHPCDPDEYELMRSAALETLTSPTVLRETLAKEIK